MTQGLENRFTKPKGWLWAHFTNARGATLRFGRLSCHKTPLAHIVFIEGLSEYAEKTFELARDFNRMACNFSVLDRQGQGKSDRYLPDRDRQHSQGVDHDVDDIIRFCRDHVPEGDPIILLGHSTGGLIALMALEKEPALFKGAILVAPLLGIASPLARDKESYIANLPLPPTFAGRYIPGGRGWTPRESKLSLYKPEHFSSDPVRNKIHDYWPQKDRDLRSGSPTLRWIVEICRAIIRTRVPGFTEKIDKPVLIFTAGQDVLINNDPTLTLAGRLKRATHHHYPDGKHELYLEKDDIRDSLLRRTHDFLKNIL